MEDFLASERELRQKGEELISELMEDAKTDESKAKLLKDYNEGKSEIIWAKDKKGVMLHRKNIEELLYNTNPYPHKTTPCFSLKKDYSSAITIEQTKVA
jgi:hypothetical protein